MDHTKTRQYVKLALQRHQTAEEIIAKLVAVGHTEDTVRRITKEVLRERIEHLEQQKTRAPKSCPGGFEGVTLEIVLSLLLRVGFGLIGAIGIGYLILQASKAI